VKKIHGLNLGEKMVLVSVIMPSYNHEKYVSKAINSVLNQSFKDFELIIIDDSSKDNSQRIISSFEEEDKRIKAIFHRSNLGIAKTLNEGLGKARGKYVALMASDDVWLETKIEKQLSVLRDDESLVVWSEGQIIDEEDVPTGETFSQLYSAENKMKSGNLFEAIVYKNFILGSSIIFKKDLLEGIKFNEGLKYYNDYKFYVDLAKKYSFYFITEALTKYRIHGKNTNTLDRKNWTRDELIFGNLILQEYGETLSSKLKSDLFWRVGSANSYFGNKNVARATIFRAIGLNPFRKDIPFVLFSALVNGDDSLARLFSRINYFLKNHLAKSSKFVLQNFSLNINEI
jgi:glycosyltransferase involved in cell wall biosynthesis